MTIILYLLKIHLISVYFFIKIIHKRKNQVCFLSRQSDNIPLNYELIMQSLVKENIPYKYVIKKINNSINDNIRTNGNYSTNNQFLKSIIKNFTSALSYYFSLYSQMRLIASSKVIITDGYNLPVCLLKHKKGTKIIQMWHALGAVKQFGYQTLGKKNGINPKIAKILKMHHNYDYVLSGTPAMNQYFAAAFNISKEKVLSLGTPTIDYIKMDNKPIIEEIYHKYPELQKKPNILYSPTFRNDTRNGYKELIDNFDFKNYNLIITFHAKVEDVINDSKVIKINSKEFNTYDILKISDYVITDYSALMLDALILNKKILFYVYDYDAYLKENGLNINLIKDYESITKKSAQDIVDIIYNNKYDNVAHKKLLKNYKPVNINSTQKIIELIKRCLNERN